MTRWTNRGAVAAPLPDVHLHPGQHRGLRPHPPGRTIGLRLRPHPQPDPGLAGRAAGLARRGRGRRGHGLRHGGDLGHAAVAAAKRRRDRGRPDRLRHCLHAVRAGVAAPGHQRRVRRLHAPGNGGRRHRPQDPRGLFRDAGQPQPAAGRHCRHLGHRARQGPLDHRRQHLRHAGAATAAAARRRHRAALGHQVPGRPRRPARRRGGRPQAAHRRDPLARPALLHRRDAVAVHRLPGVARPEDAGIAGRAPQRIGIEGGEVPARARGGSRRVLSGPGGHGRRRDRAAPAGGRRRPGGVRTEGRAGRRPAPARQPEAGAHRRQPGRPGNPDPASGHHDARQLHRRGP